MEILRHWQVPVLGFAGGGQHLDALGGIMPGERDFRNAATRKRATVTPCKKLPVALVMLVRMVNSPPLLRAHTKVALFVLPCPAVIT